MARWRIVLLTCAIVAHPAGVRAQRSVEGVLFDSLRTGAPIAGAEVRLLGTAQRVRTDAGGRFRFDSVPGGATGVGFHAPWLDSLDLPALRRSLDARTTPGARVDLATPSFETFFESRCGVPPAPDAALLIGEVRTLDGEPGAATAVAARWTSTVVRGREIETVPMATIDTSRSSGSYSLCGVPRGFDVDVSAHGGPARAGPVRVAVGQAVQRLDLVLGAGEARLRLRGRVVGADSGSLAGARVALYGDTVTRAVSGAGGDFELSGVPASSGSIEVTAVGHLPAVVAFDPRDVSEGPLRVELAPLPQPLSEVEITAAHLHLYDRERLGFEERRKGAVGWFLGEEDLRGIPDISANVLGAKIARLLVRQVYPRPVLQLRGSVGTGVCDPRWFVDGSDLGVLKDKERWPEQWDALQRAKRVEVYTASNSPPRFNDFTGCGAIVIWTR